MSNSNLVSYIDTGAGKWDYRTGSILKIRAYPVTVAYDLSAYSAILRTKLKCSWNYAIDPNGKIGLFVEEQYASWASQNSKDDNVAITIYISNKDGSTEWKMSDETYNALLDLCEDICRRNKFVLPQNTIFIDGYSNIAKIVNTRLQQPSKLKYVQNANIQNTTYETKYIGDTTYNQSLVNYHALTPYIATITRKTTQIDWDTWKSIGVSGIVVEAGSLYNEIHMEVPYENPNLKSQVKFFNDNRIPYGLYAEVRARSVEEAQKELVGLKRVLRKYQPRLGIWLHLNLSKPLLINDAIIAEYETALTEWGWSGRIGIYANKQQIENISWKSRWCNTMYLWIDDHIKSLSYIDQLLTPSFFSV